MSLYRTTYTCQHCGRVFSDYISHGPRQFCGRACSNAAHTLNHPHTCEQCGTSFLPTNISSTNRFCSTACAGDSRRQPLEERFWSKVRKTDGCWEWTGALFKTGYGAINVNEKAVKAHRLAYELTYGPFDPSLDVCHHCDMPSCVRPDHLFLGTARDNMQDMRAKGRQNDTDRARGEAHPRAKLTDTDVRNIRARLANGENMRSIARLYNVDASTIAHIRDGIVWNHVP